MNTKDDIHEDFDKSVHLRNDIVISIVIPCYNEAENLLQLLKICYKLSLEFPRIEFVFVNNGSTDSTAEILRKASENEKPHIKVVTVRKNIGYGDGILRGLEQADGNILSWTHADLQTDPGDVCKAIAQFDKEFSNGSAIIKGQRCNRPFIDYCFTVGMSCIASILLRTRLSDINAQPKIFPRSFLPILLKDAPLDFALDTWMLYQAKKAGMKILSFPVYYGKRTAGTAKGGGVLRGKWKLSLRTLSFLIKLARHKE